MSENNIVNVTTKKTVVVLFSGKMHCGKTTSADILLEELSINIPPLIRIKKVSFAHMIKEIATRYFYWDGEKDEKGRKLLQDLGTVGRNYYKQTWYRNLEESQILSGMFPPNFVIIDDWRYPDEAEYFKSNRFYDVVTVRIERHPINDDKTELLNHISEISLPTDNVESLKFQDNKIYNFVIINGGTIEDLGAKLKSSVVPYLKSKLIYKEKSNA